MDDPYRTPAVVETVEQRREKLRQRILGLGMMNGHGMSLEDRAKWKAEYDRLHSLLFALR